jgi:DNA protecting protein DprA
MNEPQSAAAYLKLMALFEGGSSHWSALYLQHGALELIEMIERGAFADYKKIGARLQESSLAIDTAAKLDELARHNSFLITRSDEDWPPGLDDLSAPPIALIGRGRREILSSLTQALSIVGTRNPSSYGVRVAGDFAAGAVDRDWVVVSGGAIGIDSAAHNGALIAEGSTIAILGSGVAANFPASNSRLFQELSEVGLLLSEVLPTVHAIPARFLIRNRLIAAISRATVVVEAAFRSGSLRTARDAAEIFRPVMAVPGPITAPTSDGCHRLIAERTAELVSSIGDLMELVGPLSQL